MFCHKFVFFTKGHGRDLWEGRPVFLATAPVFGMAAFGRALHPVSTGYFRENKAPGEGRKERKWREREEGGNGLLSGIMDEELNLLRLK